MAKYDGAVYIGGAAYIRPGTPVLDVNGRHVGFVSKVDPRAGEVDLQINVGIDLHEFGTRPGLIAKLPAVQIDAPEPPPGHAHDCGSLDCAAVCEPSADAEFGIAEFSGADPAKPGQDRSVGAEAKPETWRDRPPLL